jgi:hypothetical protein
VNLLGYVDEFDYAINITIVELLQRVTRNYIEPTIFGKLSQDTFVIFAVLKENMIDPQNEIAVGRSIKHVLLLSESVQLNMSCCSVSTSCGGSRFSFIIDHQKHAKNFRNG